MPFQLTYLGPIKISHEPWLYRVTTSRAISGREISFCKGVRERDKRCVISGEVNSGAQWGCWAGFDASHVFPLEYEGLWVEDNYGRWITNMDSVAGISKINSTQNGLLMNATFHTQFDQYLISINPDVSILDIELVKAILTWQRTVIR
jgi:hypothetical protein